MYMFVEVNYFCSFSSVRAGSSMNVCLILSLEQSLHRVYSIKCVEWLNFDRKIIGP